MAPTMQEQFESAYSEANGGLPMAFIQLQRQGDSYATSKIARAWTAYKNSGLLIEQPETKDRAFWESSGAPDKS